MSQRLFHKKTRLAGNISQKTTLVSYNVICPTDGVRASDKQKVTIVSGAAEYLAVRSNANVKKNISVAVIGLVLAGISVAAEQSFVPPPAGLQFSAPWRPAGAKGDTRILGTVIDIRQVAVAKVKVQLRNLDTGAVMDEAETNANGEYEFDVETPSSFVVEMVLVGGYVIAISNAGSLARFDTLQTVIQLPGRWDTVRQNLIPNQVTLGFVGVSAQTSLTGATLTLAVGQGISPVSAGEPVSPLR